MILIGISLASEENGPALPTKNVVPGTICSIEFRNEIIADKKCTG
jgi:hypothetical protein